MTKKNVKRKLERKYKKVKTLSLIFYKRQKVITLTFTNMTVQRNQKKESKKKQKKQKKKKEKQRKKKVKKKKMKP